MDIIINHLEDAYHAPIIRIIDMHLEMSFLASNLEPIDGGNDPDIDW